MLRDRVQQLERQLRNATLRETRAKRNLQSALEALRDRNLLTEDLQSRLDIFSGLSLLRYWYKQ